MGAGGLTAELAAWQQSTTTGSTPGMWAWILAIVVAWWIATTKPKSKGKGKGKGKGR